MKTYNFNQNVLPFSYCFFGDAAKLLIQFKRQCYIKKFKNSFNSPETRYEPEDQLEWSLVLEEIKGFIKAEAAVAVLHADSNPIVLSHR